jgi:hypothetical protein
LVSFGHGVLLSDLRILITTLVSFGHGVLLSDLRILITTLVSSNS